MERRPGDWRGGEEDGGGVGELGVWQELLLGRSGSLGVGASHLA